MRDRQVFRSSQKKTKTEEITPLRLQDLDPDVLNKLGDMSMGHTRLSQTSKRMNQTICPKRNNRPCRILHLDPDALKTDHPEKGLGEKVNLSRCVPRNEKNRDSFLSDLISRLRTSESCHTTTLILEDIPIPTDSENVASHMKGLFGSPHLTHLSLHSVGIGSITAGLIGHLLSKNTTLKRLDISWNKIYGLGATQFAEALNNKTLQTLNVIHGNLGDQGAKAMAGLLTRNKTALTSLDIDLNHIGPQGAIAMGEALETNTMLTSLNLHANEIGVTGAYAIAKALAQNKKTALTSLNLDFNRIRSEGATAIAYALSTNTILASLRLETNHIGDVGASYLAESIQSQKTALTFLNLEDNNITSEGAAAIAKALKSKNTILKTLLLHTNIIGEAGAQEIAEALKSNTTLNSLGLRENQIGSSGASAIAHALHENKGLTSLDLESNDIQAGVIAIAFAVKANTILKSLDLRANAMGTEAAIAMGLALESNTTLNSLSFQVDRIGVKGCEAIENVIRNTKTLTSIDIKNSEWLEMNSHAGFHSPELNYEFYNAVLQNPTIKVFNEIPVHDLRTDSITELDLSGRDLNLDEVRILYHFLRRSSVLTFLDVSFGRLGVVVGESGNLEFQVTPRSETLFRGLLGNLSLRSLIMQDNEIKNMGESLALIIKKNQLTTLDISENRLLDDNESFNNFKTMMNAVKKNKTLRTLSMQQRFVKRNYSLNYEGLIPDTLKENTSLTSLDISRNYINILEAQAIARAVLDNPHSALKTLSIDISKIDIDNNEGEVETWNRLLEQLSQKGVIVYQGWL